MSVRLAPYPAYIRRSPQVTPSAVEDQMAQGRRLGDQGAHVSPRFCADKMTQGRSPDPFAYRRAFGCNTTFRGCPLRRSIDVVTNDAREVLYGARCPSSSGMAAPAPHERVSYPERPFVRPFGRRKWSSDRRHARWAWDIFHSRAARWLAGHRNTLLGCRAERTSALRRLPGNKHPASGSVVSCCSPRTRDYRHGGTSAIRCASREPADRT